MFVIKALALLYPAARCVTLQGTRSDNDELLSEGDAAKKVRLLTQRAEAAWALQCEDNVKQ